PMTTDATELAVRAADRARDAAERAREAAEEAADRPTYETAASFLAENPGLAERFRRRVRAQAIYRRGEALHAKRDYAGAHPLLSEAVALDPDHDEARALLGWSEYLRGDYRAAIVTFKMGLRRQPSWEGLHDGLGWSRLRLGRFYLASTAFRAALDRNPEYVDAVIGLGSAQFELGRYATSLSYLDNALRRLEPRFGEGPSVGAGVRAQVAWNLYYLGRYGEAVEMFEKTITTQPGWYGLYNGAGWSYLGLGRKAEARSAFEKALSLKPGYEDAREGLSLATDQPANGRGRATRAPRQ
ncbi:MAG: tetratricopeptide repeat protein, partial [Candidatus Rokuibacteriota bacterium]